MDTAPATLSAWPPSVRLTCESSPVSSWSTFMLGEKECACAEDMACGIQAGQELKRRIRNERWEQEKRWREEDRAARHKVPGQRRRPERAQRNLKSAARISYLTLVCHENTWTFMATEAYGIWRPHWTQSTVDFYVWCLGRHEVEQFTEDPNLPKSRITKHDNGMQKIVLSGHSLVRLLDKLRDGTAADDVVRAPIARVQREAGQPSTRACPRPRHRLGRVAPRQARRPVDI